MATQKLCLVGFNAKLGMKLILECYLLHLSRDFDVFAFTEEESHCEAPKTARLYPIAKPGGHLSIALDCLNVAKIIKIFNLLWQERPQIVYIVSNHPFNIIAALSVKLINFLLPGAAIKIIYHTHDVLAHPGLKNSLILESIQQVTVRLSDYVTVYGDYLKATTAKYFKLPQSKIFSYRHGVNRTVENHLAPTGNDLDKKYVSFVGRLEAYKGIDVFLKIVEQLEERLDCQFLLAGVGNLSAYTAQLNSLTRLTVVNRFLTNEEIDAMLQVSYVLVLPYREASQSGMTPIAYYNACPVVVSDVGGLPEIVVSGETGFIAPLGNTQALIESIERLVNQPELRQKLSSNCFEYYQKYLKWETIFEQVVMFLKSL